MKKQIGIYDHATGETIVRDMTEQELAEYGLGANSKAKRESDAAQTDTDKAALLAKMGLTSDEAKLLLS